MPMEKRTDFVVLGALLVRCDGSSAEGTRSLVAFAPFPMTGISEELNSFGCQLN